MSRYGLDVPSHNDETAWKQPLHKSQCLLQHQVIGGLRGQSKCMPLVTSMVKKPIKGDPHPRSEHKNCRTLIYRHHCHHQHGILHCSLIQNSPSMEVS
ncbi:hypothetical protein HanOQP8_Chr03g0089581 [Helianthus annuus]|nr:hypothetical protein HanOQP8_Chr03g0089581 [Helianthus annuus]